jgi:biopolymer transport protein ExbD
MLLQRQLSADVDADLDLTAMVDVIFQLLTFLLLTYQPVPGEVEVPKARYGYGVDQDTAVVLIMQPPAEPGGTARVLAVEAQGAPRTLENDDAIRQAVSAGITGGRRRVVLQADGRVPHREVLRVAATAAEIEGTMLHVGVQEP